MLLVPQPVEGAAVMNRRSFLRGLGAIIAAPTVITTAGVFGGPIVEALPLLPVQDCRQQLTMADIMRAVQELKNRGIPPIDVDGRPYYLFVSEAGEQRAYVSGRGEPAPALILPRLIL